MICWFSFIRSSTQWGVHHLVLPAVLETPPGRDCFGHIDVFNDRLELVGVDTMMSMTLPFLTRHDMEAVNNAIIGEKVAGRNPLG